MDPGSRREKVKVYEEVFTETDHGMDYGLQLVGEYHVQIIEVTRSTFYSGTEGVNVSKFDIGRGAIRMVFNMNRRFDHNKVQFHYDGEVFTPTGRGTRLSNSHYTKYSYNVELLEDTVAGDHIIGGGGSGS